MAEVEEKWRELCNIECMVTAKSFHHALKIWLKKPHVLNRRLCASTLIQQSMVTLNSSMLDLVLTRKMKHFLKDTSECADLTKDLLCCVKKILLSADDDQQKAGFENQPTTEHQAKTEVNLLVRDLVPKRIDKCRILRELVLIDRIGGLSVFVPVIEYFEDKEKPIISSALWYAFKIDEEENRIYLYTSGDSTVKTGMTGGCTEDWLKDHMLKKLLNWSKSSDLNTDVSSLKLISVPRYNEVYQSLKMKYGLDLVKNWTESTDPQKFVFEDIAIASYLLCLWEDERKKEGTTVKQSFVDLGCGNGLLVHLLSLEGHSGLGVDVRRRKIWDLFSNADLKEVSITPSDEHLFPEADWLIGNHSDELTPWIPVIAARSSTKCRFFVLPCCPHDFDRRFSDKRCGDSIYQSYLKYINQVAEVCGFQASTDTLRIPSTKRSCIIGKKRSQESDFVSVNERIAQFIKERCLSNSAENDTRQNIIDNEKTTLDKSSNNVTEGQSSERDAWTSTFKARPYEESTSGMFLGVDFDLKESITATVANALLTQDGTTVLDLGDRKWNKGGKMSLESVASLLGRQVLQRLKKECGGLQALLRTCNHIFRVQGGDVYLRDWSCEEEVQRVVTRMKKGKSQKRSGYDPSDLRKTKLCWFNANHPDGCPRHSETCNFAHGHEELRDAPHHKHLKAQDD